MKKYKNLKIRLVLIFVLLALIIGLSELFYKQMIESATDKCWEELAMAHSDAVREIGTRLNTNVKMLDLASDAIVMNADFSDEKGVLSYLESVREETIFDRIDVVFPDGTILLQTSGERVKDNGEKTYNELVAKGSHISQRVSDFLTGNPAIHIFSPVYDSSDNPVAILGATVYCSTLSEIFSSAHYGEDAQLFLVDLRDGNIVLDKRNVNPGSVYDMSDYKLPEKYKDRNFISEIMAGNSGELSYTSKKYKKTSYTIYAPVPDTNFSLTMVLQEDVIFSDVNEMKTVLMRVGVAETIFLIIFCVWIYFAMRKSVRAENRVQKAELELLHKKEHELQTQFDDATKRKEFLETMAVNLPGGYHRCTTDHNFYLTFISNSFTQVTGYNMEQLKNELNGSYMGIVAPEDREYFMSLAPQLERDGHIHCAYRILRRDGQLRWVQDTTQYVERDGEKYYQCALMDISEQIDELERAKHEAEASNQAKSTFLFNISHDIRTPMNAIKGFSHIIEENSDKPELVVKTIAKINKASDSLMMLINDILDISRIERGKEEVNLKPVNLYEHGRNLYEMFASDMKTQGIEFIPDGDKLTDYVYCDELKMTRIMMNMLSNAKKFTPKGGKVSFGGTRLHCDENSCTYRFFVRDTGIGMSKEFQKRAFEQFERERTSTESGVAGSGLGLAIIKMLVDLMGGTVEIKSELGKGTEISVVLTLQLADKNQVEGNDLQSDDLSVMENKCVLLVEDNEFNREIAKYVLEGLKLKVTEAENGAVCIEKLRSDDYDLILMDIQMPVMDGYTATIEIRNLTDKKKASIPIIAMTANAFEEDRKKCLEVGMDGHIGKPIDADLLTELLIKLFTKKTK